MKLTEKNYFEPESNRAYMSASQFKAFASCEASALAELKAETSRKPSDAMLRGSYLDAMVEGTAAEFEAEHPELWKKNGELYAAFASVPDLFERMMRDEFFKSYLKGDKQTILTGQIEGVPVKAKLDILHPDRIVDLKTTANFKRQWDPDARLFVSFAEFWSYDIQGAIYQELVRQSTGKSLPFYLAAITTEPVPDLAVIHIPDDSLKFALDEVKLSIGRYQAVKLGFAEPSRCEKCAYCKQTKKLTGAIDWLEIGE